MGKIRHRNVIRLKHVEWDAKYEKKDGTKIDVILVVLELADGGELFEFLSYTGSFDEKIARTYFKQLIDGLDYCHTQGVSHRDLKPENLLLDSNFILKLADFGFSSVFNIAGSRLMYTECGTPAYMAPEMFNSKGYDPVVADIWACGVILFIMLAGFPPFQKPNMSDWWFNKLNTGKTNLFWQAHSRSANFSDSTKDLINKILQPEPLKRISIAELRKHAWFEGPVISDERLIDEFKKRKENVDETKERKKQEKKQLSSQQIEDTSIGAQKFKDLETLTPSTEKLPESSPLWDFEKYVVVANKVELTDSNSLFSSSFSVETKTAPNAPIYDNERVQTCYTRFESMETPSKIMSRLSKYFEELKASHSCDESNYFLKATVMTTTSSVILCIQIYIDPQDPTKSIVLFRRRKGDSMQFRSIYYDIRYCLKDLVVLAPATTAATTTVTTTATTATTTAISSVPETGGSK